MFNYNPKVSIIIPAYNASNYLSQAIDCALNQTYDNTEIIVVNDGSTDNGATEKVALSYGDKIKYFSKDNGGSSSALNFGINQMTGEWFSWLSHDDLYKSDKIYKQIELLNKLDLSSDEIKNHIVSTGAEFINKNGKVIKTQSKKELKKMEQFIFVNQGKNEEFVSRIIEMNLHGCSFLISKKLLSDVGCFDEKLRLVNDVDMWFRLYKNGAMLHYIPEILV